MKEEKDRLCGYPGYQQESAGCYSQHQERAEIVIFRLPAQWAFFFHGLAGVLRLSQLLKKARRDLTAKSKSFVPLVGMIFGIRTMQSE